MKVYHVRRESNFSLDDGYIGITKREIEERFREHKRDPGNPHFRNALNKYNDIIIEELYDGSENACKELEFHLRPLENMGWNKNPGGGCPIVRYGKEHHLYGKKRNPETVEKIRQKSLKHRHSEETKKKISENSKKLKHTDKSKKKMSEARKGIKKTDDHKSKISKALKGSNNGGKEVIQIQDGIEIKKFDSATHAARELGNGNYGSTITKVCRGKRKSAYGFSWKYA